MDNVFRLTLTILCSVGHSISTITESMQYDPLLGTVDQYSSTQANHGGGFGETVSKNITEIMKPSELEIQNSLSEIENQISSEETVDEDFFHKHIDKANTVFDGFGPHLLTKTDSISINERSEIMIDTAMKTADRVYSRLHKDQPGFASKINKSKKNFLTGNRESFDHELGNLCPYNVTLCCIGKSKYRTADGSCNNLDNPYWGKALTPFERFAFPHYDDGIQKPRSLDVNGQPLPGPREVSLAVHKKSTNKHKSELSHFAMEFGQFVSHDIQFTALSKGHYMTNLNCCERQRKGLSHRNCIPISLPKNDPFFGQPNINRTCMNLVRSLASVALDCHVGPRQQINQNTHFLDGSAIYGSDDETMNSLRLKREGLLKTFQHIGRPLLPQDTSPTASCLTSGTNHCFRAGDARVNQQPGLISLQTVWHREHNRIAGNLKSVNPKWNDEKLFQEARRINVAQLQHVTYNEYLLEILGHDNMFRFDLKPKSSGYFTKYNKTVKPMIRNAFSAAAYRFGHSMIDDKLAYHTAGTSPNILLDLRKVLLRPDWIYRTDGGVSAVIRGLYETNSQKVDMKKSFEITRHLFEGPVGTGFDLAAINIQRGRDHGIPPYNFWRKLCDLDPADSIRTGKGGLVDHTEEAVEALKSIYKSVHDIDLFTGGVSETPVGKSRVGPTFACLIGTQFKALKYGDRFFYEGNQDNIKFDLAQLKEIRNTLMANIICRNTDISKIHRNVFRQKHKSFEDMPCSSFKNDLDFTKWKETVYGLHRR